MMVMALASVIIGTSLFRRVRFVKATAAVVLGSILYKTCLVVAMQLGLPTNLLKLLMAVLFTVALVSQQSRIQEEEKAVCRPRPALRSAQSATS